MLALLLTGSVQVQTPPFVQTVLQSFAAWDANADQALSTVEIEKATLDPKYHGESAAALAALHTWLAATKTTVPSLTRTWFQQYVSAPLKLSKDLTPAEVKAARKAYAASPESMESTYLRAFKRLKKAPVSNLYDQDGPSVSDIRQGALGDCYLLAPIGGAVHRDPKVVEKMIEPAPDGFRVKFGDGREVHVAPLTDAELAMGGSSTSAGLWIRILEKAYGSRKFTNGETHVAVDGMSGGNPGVAAKALTGHKFISIPLIGDYKKEVTPETVSDKLERLRKELPVALAAKDIIVAGTTSKPAPPSINPNHAYAVFDYDAVADRITVWNPHGTDFKPKGEEGLQYGFARKEGVFSMPLELFVRTFGRIYFEKAE